MDHLAIQECKDALMDTIFRAVKYYEAVTGEGIKDITVNRLTTTYLDPVSNSLLEKSVCTSISVEGADIYAKAQ